MIHNVHTIPHVQNPVKFMHQVFFFPPIQTLLCAANLGFLDGFPFLAADLIHKHLPKSPAMANRHKHKPPRKPQHSPHATPPCKFGHDALEPIKHDHQPLLPPDRIKRIQQIIGTILYYARAVDITTLVTLSSITAKQTKATESTKTRVVQLLDYLYTHKDATIQYVASDMVLNVHSDASYFSEPKAHSHLGGFS